ncbi:MAG TPA: GWxTD domain-containing protein [Thermoanaerobaculia bacterium]|nr:GWxTD domain-containing protein [Thermoanaerobaculia bacterium]
MKNSIRIFMSLALLATAGMAFAHRFEEFGKGPASYFMTAEEHEKWSRITTDAEAEAFINEFWARRDPSPGTPKNEFRDEFDRRVKMADERFSVRGGKKGSLTDRGRILIVFSSPSKIVTQAEGQQQTQDPLQRDDTASRPGGPSRQIWTYEKERAARAFGVENRVDILFIDRLGSGEYLLQLPSIDLAAAQKRMIEGVIVQTAAPAPQPVAAAPAPAPAAVPATDFRTAAFQTAVDELKGGKSTLNQKATLGYAELVSPDGEYFVPVQLYIPQAAGLTADAADTLFAVVEDAAGSRVRVVEEPVKLTATKEDFFVDTTFEGLGEGKYTITAGLAKGGQPVLIASSPVELKPIARDHVGVSRLLLLDDIYELQQAAPVKAPFAFGRLKIVPKSDLAFSNKDELGYFVEVFNPAIDPTTNLPKIQVKIELSGGKLAKPIVAPLSEVQAAPLTGAPGPGQYAIVNTIPLGQLSKPLEKGDYALKMKIVDTLAQKSYNIEQKFKIVG